ncbi:MAG: phage protease [Clostridiaceae bacterium]|nr:phage protease [Clostridiaceae bacterium]
MVKSRKGDFLVDDQSFQELKNYFEERKIDVVIDYEHQTLTGNKAPAAGWIKGIEKTDEGIVANVHWTEKAKEYLANKEYRYLSPVVMKRKSDGRAVELHSAGLTNTPAIDGMVPIINSNKVEEEDEMELKEIALSLGLKEDATQEEIVLAVKKLNEKTVVANKEILQELELQDDATVEDVKGKLIALKNPAGYVSAEEFRNLQQQVQEQQKSDLVELALSTGKITPAQKDWAEEYALKDPKAFKNFLDKAPRVVPMKEIETKKKSAGGGEKLDDLEMKVNSMLGISDEDVKKYGKDDE